MSAMDLETQIFGGLLECDSEFVQMGDQWRGSIMDETNRVLEKS